jgi:hypothetical protein
MLGIWRIQHRASARREGPESWRLPQRKSPFGAGDKWTEDRRRVLGCERTGEQNGKLTDVECYRTLPEVYG